MNILFVNATHNWGGVKTWMIDVALGLRDKGHTIFIMGRPGPFTIKTHELGFHTTISSFGIDFSPFRIAQCMAFCKRHRINRVVVNTGKDIRTAALAARLLAIPVIHRVGSYRDMRNTWKVRLTQQYIKPHILAPCQQIKQDMPKILPWLDPGRITVILDGKAIAQKPTPTGTAPFRCISTSQVNADKGINNVLIILGRLKQQGIPFRYDVVGTGREVARLKALAADLGISSEVVWHGFQKDVIPFLRKADIFILPSVCSEGLPHAMLEAMAQGLVCIARDVGGVIEGWPQEPWASPYLLPLDDEEKMLQSSLAKLLTSTPETIQDLKQKFFEHAIAHCNLKTHVDLLDEWIQNLGSTSP
ncbi:MAG: glycosyltransferase [Desulfobacterales bacterium]|nr:MAG: glycosyltransferase [Desulfobacterales bacterium]